MLTVLYGNISALGGAVASIVPAVNGLIPEEAALSFTNNFKGLSMIGISIIGIFLAVLHYQNARRTVVAAPVSNVESGEIEDDEF